MMESDLQPALKLLNNARSYSEAVKTLNTTTQNRRKCELLHLSQSAAIYAGLAVDCYLKTLYYLDHRKPYNEQGKTPHDFYLMYQTLKLETRKGLEERFKAILSKRERKNVPRVDEDDDTQPLSDVEGILKGWTKAFMYLRVAPMKFNKKHMVFFHELEECFKSLILKQKPKWETERIQNTHKQD